jgi:hypothetical protein
MVEKDSVDRELACRLCAAFVSCQLGITVATQYKNTPEEVGDLCGTSWRPCRESW